MAKETNREARTREENQDSQAQADIWKYVFGFTEMAVVKCAIELGIADFLESSQQPVSLNQLSVALGCCSSSLYRVLRFLINRGIFKETSTGNGEISYVQTPLSRLLRKEGGNSMAAFVLFESSPVMLAPWHNLSARVLSKENTVPAFDAAHGKDVWKFAETDPGYNNLLNKAMACDARVSVSAIINGCPEIFKGISSLVDVGGGDGTALRILVEAFPWIKGINFDLPHVASVAPHSNSVQHVGGDMFDYVPKADAAFLMWVLHDWGDDECIQILRKCGEAIPKDTGKVIIVEAVIGKGDERKEDDKLKDVGLMLDMVMMAHTSNGKERTAKEWAYVLSAAGFSRHTINHIDAVQSVIQAYL
ncbi:PREDICTED: (RS)-norcoclaurine 6-O-methyltransferase-like [Nicotiana attenuata]|uniref:Trans-resveratrol di-o-methyltransferase n=1 Tax=Nicotiana attenuata TaxID=49451 RepID=A0A1J6KSP6_NICAT|nr:PREDICTED: (RS)-norcoclaurine 6-O-methyltransferase-like [Nicotiana attenuata]OIT27800.1 trans-resveratrol di-o-methyltransferase [Nicotiana attenuata]